MKEEILKLRQEGKTYLEISKILNCSKATVSYYCGEGQREKSLNRTKQRRKTIVGNIDRRVTGFIRRLSRDFRNSAKKGERNVTTHYFTTTEILNKVGVSPKCYLTGDSIDLLNYKSYQFDHVIPVSKGGQNSLENLNIATRNANMAKSDMTIEELLELCEKILKTHKPELLK